MDDLDVEQFIATSGKWEIEMLPNEQTAVARRGSEFRILDQGDLRLAAQPPPDESVDIGDRGLSFTKVHEEDTASAKLSTITIDQLTSENEDGLTSDQAERLIEIYGLNELPEYHIPRWYLFISQLWQPMPIMIWMAAIILVAVDAYIDASILIVLNIANASIAYHESVKAGDAVAALKASLRPTAVCKRDQLWKRIDASLLCPGDKISLCAGSNVPADCRIHATLDVDQSTITGESMPVSMYHHDQAKMGSTIVHGESEATVEFTGINTYFGRTASMLGGQHTRSSNLQSFLQKVVIILTSISIVFVVTALIYLLIGPASVEFKDALRFIVVLLVASIPLAIEIISTTTLALGSSEVAKCGVICTRLASLEDLASMSILCCDKTGTLTTNKMQLREEAPVYYPTENRDSLLRYAAMSTRWLEPARDALDTLILEHVDLNSLHQIEQLNFIPFDPVIKRTESTILDGTDSFRVSKGSPHVILELCKKRIHDLHVSSAAQKEISTSDSSEEESDTTSDISCTSSGKSAILRGNNVTMCGSLGGHASLAHQIEHDVKMLGHHGIRCLAVARTIHNNVNDERKQCSDTDIDDTDEWIFLGLLTFLDPARIDTKETISSAKKLGISVKMITGDHILIAKDMAKTLNMGTRMYHRKTLPQLTSSKKKPSNLIEKYGRLILEADGFAEVYPEHKYLVVECLREMGYKVGMTGDGVNDAPALKAADVGIAVQGSTDAAKASADLVLTKPGLNTIIKGLSIARQTFGRIRSFIIYRIAATLQLLFFFFIAVFIFNPSDYEPEPEEYQVIRPWPVFFSLPVLLLMLITVLNDGTLISIAYDTTKPSAYPEKWSLPLLFVVGGSLGAIACLSSLLLLYSLLNSWNPAGVYQLFGLGPDGLSYGQITTSIFLKVAVSDFLTLFSARAGEDSVFYALPPPTMLLAAGTIALLISTLLSLSFPEVEMDNIYIQGLARRQPYILPVYIWVYCLLFFLLQDCCKVCIFWILHRYELLGLTASSISNTQEQQQLDTIARVDEVEGDVSDSSNSSSRSVISSIKCESTCESIECVLSDILDPLGHHSWNENQKLMQQYRKEGENSDNDDEQIGASEDKEENEMWNNALCVKLDRHQPSIV
jgi:H+-transporting ATPase